MVVLLEILFKFFLINLLVWLFNVFVVLFKIRIFGFLINVWVIVNFCFCLLLKFLFFW